MADAELGVILEPKNDLEDEVDDVKVGVTGGGGDGDMTPGQREEQESVVSGGVAEGLGKAAVLAGILSQLKSVTGIISAVLGTISRALVPAVEVLADLLRPVIESVNNFLSAPGETIQNAATEAGVGQQAREQGETGPFTGIGGTISREQAENLGPDQLGGPLRNVGGNIADFLFGDKAADQTGEANKQSFLNILKEGSNDKLGGSRR